MMHRDAKPSTRTAPVVRANQRVPFRKATYEQAQDRTEWVALKIAIQPTLKTGELKAIIKEKFGLQWQQALNYITRAKKLLQQRANYTKEGAKQIAVNALLDQMQNESGSVRTAAIRVWTDVFGFQAPTQLRVGDPTGKPLAATVVAPIVNFNFPGNQRNGALHNGNGTADNKLRTAAGKAD
jgi:hypothetical protein